MLCPGQSHNNNENGMAKGKKNGKTGRDAGSRKEKKRMDEKHTHFINKELEKIETSRDEQRGECILYVGLRGFGMTSR